MVCTCIPRKILIMRNLLQFQFTVCLVLVIASTRNVKVSAAAQLYEAKTLEGGCPHFNHFEAVKLEILHNIGALIDEVSETITASLSTTDLAQTTDHEESTSTSTDPVYMYTCNGTPGWRQVVFINMTDTSYNCPPGLKLTSYSKRTCGRAHSNWRDCSSTTFSAESSEYSRVCGRIRGYQVGFTSAFYGNLLQSHSIENQYVDGVSLTYGPVGRRQHIWTYAAGVTEIDNNRYTQEKCPCDTSDASIIPPPFVSDDYFCESGLHTSWDSEGSCSRLCGVLFPDDPLWDGENCTSTSTCCQLHNPPWFTKNLPNPTTDDIELRLCLSYGENSDDTPLELIELYIQ